MSKPKVFLTRIILEDGLKQITDVCDADVWPHDLPPSRDELIRHMRGVDGLLCLLTDPIDGEVMDAAGPKLKVISNHAVGFDNIAVSDATHRRIPVGNTPGILTDATADMAFALMMAAGRRIVEGDRTVRNAGWKTWSPSFMIGSDFAGATLGIVGFGRIGQAVARRASGFRMRVIFYDTQASASDPALEARSVDLETLLRDSDFVTIHTPLNAQTHHLVNAGFLAAMKSTAVLINTSRGGVLDQTALYEALKSRRIFAAALDVSDPEPLPTDDPLLELDNLVVCPHIASASRSTRANMSRIAAENLLAGLWGNPLPYCVNPEVYAKR
jgi:glyoxylate reductase